MTVKLLACGVAFLIGLAGCVQDQDDGEGQTSAPVPVLSQQPGPGSSAPAGTQGEIPSSGPGPLPDAASAPVLLCPAPCVRPMGTVGGEPWLAMDPQDPGHAVAMAMRQSSHGPATHPWAVISVTKDGGATWSHAEPPGAVDQGGVYGFFADPMVAFAADGTVVAAGLVAEGAPFVCTVAACAGAPASARSLDLVVWRSPDGGATWSDPQPVAEALVGIVAVSVPTAGVYQQMYTTEAHDRELLVADRATGRLTLLWNGLSATGTRMLESHSDDNGTSWSDPMPVEGAGYGPNAVAHDGRIVLTYKRAGQAPSFDVQESLDAGATWGAAETVAPMPGPNWQPAPAAMWQGQMRVAVPTAQGFELRAPGAAGWQAVHVWSAGQETAKRDIGFVLDDEGTGILAFYDGDPAALMVAPVAAGVVGTPQRIGDTTTDSWLLFEYMGVDCQQDACMVVWPATAPEYGLQSAMFRWAEG